MPRSVWLLIIGMLVNVTGSSFLWPLNTIYLNQHLGQTLTMAGFVLMLNAAAGVVGNLLGGILFDKIGGYKSIMLGVGISLVALIALTFWHGWPHYVWFLTILGFSSGIVFPSMFALVGTVWPEGGRKAFNAIYLAQNLGVAIGPALAGIVADIGFDYIFIANLAMYVVFFFIAVIGYRNMNSKEDGPRNVISESKVITNKAPFYALLIVSSSFLLCWIAYSQWPSTLSSYMQQLGISLKEYSLLWTINGFLIIILQPIVSPLVRKWEKQIKVQLVFGIVVMMVSFIVIIFAEDFKMFAVSMVILTIGEIFVWPAVPTIANQLAPKGREGFYQGIVNSASTIGKMIGPFAGGIIVDQYGMMPLIWILCSLLIIAIIPCLFYDRPLKQEN